MSKAYPHHSGYTGSWPWPHFTPQEVSCKHCGELYLEPGSMDALEKLRRLWGRPIVINSAHRCLVHNRAVGGASNSQHLTIAFDCRCSRDQQAAFMEAAKQAGFTGMGDYPKRGFVHLDMRPRKADGGITRWTA